MQTSDIVVKIDELGHQGDGLGIHQGAPVYVPFSLPGEEVTVHLGDGQKGDGRKAVLDKIISSSPSRIDPLCRHFSRCGGCKLQHAEVSFYKQWKQDQVRTTLGQRGLDGFVLSPLKSIPDQSRRRTTFTARRKRGDGLLFGYLQAASHDIEGIEECPLLDPAIVEAWPELKKLAQLLLDQMRHVKKPAEVKIAVTKTETGLDIAVKCTPRPNFERAPLVLQDLSDLANAADWARLAVDGEIIAQMRVPQLNFGKAKVGLPLAGFCQATVDSEQEIVRLVVEHVDANGPVVDLFSGIGTLTFPLAERVPVHAVEGEREALAALEQARDATSELKAITVERRDLFRNPLSAKELNRFDAIIFDPPRAGAKEQAEDIALSEVKTVIGVSCNPATFSRDAETLQKGGYELRHVFPVDQFLWSPHIEVVGIFKRRD